MDNLTILTRFLTSDNYISISFPVSFVKCSATSCYTIFQAGNTWTENQKSCQKDGGDLVSMETEAEWQFINGLIQKRTLPGFLPNEWHIGLRKEGGVWKWVSGRPLTIAKWQPGRPDSNEDFAVMSKDYPAGSQGLFDDLANDQRRAYICEKTKGKTGRKV